MPQTRRTAKLPKQQPERTESRPKRLLDKLSRLPEEFYARDPRQVAPELLGKILLRRDGTRNRVGRIVEVEAYLGIDDAAAHAAAGRTKRNDVLFGPPGLAYIYFIYGFHYCLNVSCEPDGTPGGILFRALEPLAGIEEMYAAREMEPQHGRTAELKLLTSGPGRLAEAFSITRERDNGKNLTSSRSDLQIVDDGFLPEKVVVTPRIGIRKAEHELLRYVIAGNPFVSGKKVRIL